METNGNQNNSRDPGVVVSEYLGHYYHTMANLHIGGCYGTVMISANFFYDVIFLLKRIILHAGLDIL